MQNIRSFIAIALPTLVRRNAVRLIDRLSESGDGVKWVPKDNLHLTLKFLGDVDNTEVPSVCKVLREVCREFEPFDLSFAGTGGFPDVSRPRVLYAGVNDPTGSLTSMVTAMEKRLADLGFKPEPRDYTPHLTLGRSRGGSRRISPDVIRQLQDCDEVVLGEMLVENIQLIASFLEKDGPTYQVMDTIDL